jgi:hypothetical protein
MRWRILRGVLAFVVVAALALPVVFEIAITVAPNRTSDGHVVMPIGQAALAMLAAPILGGIAAYFAARHR